MARQQITVSENIHLMLKRMAAMEGVKTNDLMWTMIKARLATYQEHTRKSVMEGVRTK